MYRDRRGKAWKLVSLHQDDSVSKVVEIWARYFDGDVPCPNSSPAGPTNSKNKEDGQEENQEDEASKQNDPEEPPGKRPRVDQP